MDAMDLTPGTVFTTLHYLCNNTKLNNTNNTKLERFARVKYFSLMGPFVSFEENGCYEYYSGNSFHDTSLSL